jgi:hypothetical protein
MSEAPWGCRLLVLFENGTYEMAIFDGYDWRGYGGVGFMDPVAFTSIILPERGGGAK